MIIPQLRLFTHEIHIIRSDFSAKFKIDITSNVQRYTGHQIIVSDSTSQDDLMDEKIEIGPPIESFELTSHGVGISMQQMRLIVL